MADRRSARLSGRIVVATHNAGKLREMRELLAPYRLDAVSAGELGLPEPEETGETFAANAAIKAEAACAATGLPAFADDTGLCIDALGGEPGVTSARFAKAAGSFAQALDVVRRRLLAGGTAPPWRAHFVSVLVFPPRGTVGFGYDPIFRPDGHGRTFGEMSSAEKHGIPADGSRALSHRARAFQDFAERFLA